MKKHLIPLFSLYPCFKSIYHTEHIVFLSEKGTTHKYKGIIEAVNNNAITIRFPPDRIYDTSWLKINLRTNRCAIYSDIQELTITSFHNSCVLVEEVLSVIELKLTINKGIYYLSVDMPE